ncbi:MAG: hypothetical protein JNJ83_06215 [Verrucomicrobiaceae bacterium]|nr:hypothetical protein [Verrucomicrobiaceae bacterium]
MKPVTWDMTGLRWNDVNLRWGDPSYLLEWFDPGWVYSPTSLSQPPPAQPKRKAKAMPKTDYLKRRDEEFSAQLTLFKNAIGDYVTTFGLTTGPTGQVTIQANDAAYFAYVLALQDLFGQNGQLWTAWKNSVREGTGSSTPPEEPTLPTAVTPVPVGIEKRFRELVKIIKANPAYTTAIGELLGIEGAAHTGPDFSTFKPIFTLEISGGQVLVRWSWQGQSAYLDMIEICVDRGQGYQFLATDTTPGYTDTTPFPATAALWKYKAIFRVGDQRVGQWSDEVSITVVA